MTREELRRVVRYINYTIKECISSNNLGTYNAIQQGFFNEQEFVGIVELNN